MFTESRCHLDGFLLLCKLRGCVPHLKSLCSFVQLLFVLLVFVAVPGDSVT